MAKKSGFDYLDGHKNKLITKVETNDRHTLIEWEEPGESDGEQKQNSTGNRKSKIPSHPDFSEAFQSLIPWVADQMVPNASKQLRQVWIDALHIRTIAFSHNDGKGITAKISVSRDLPVDGGNRTVSAILTMPAYPLFNKDAEGHASNTVTTFPEEATASLNLIMQEAQMYLGGKRGDGKNDGGMFSRNTEGDAA